MGVVPDWVFQVVLAPGQVMRVFSPESTQLQELVPAGKSDWGLSKMTLQEPDTLDQTFFCMMCPACLLQWLFLHHTHHTDSYNMAFSPCSSAYRELAVPRGTQGFGYPFWKGVSLVFLLRHILSARCWIKILSSCTIISFIGRWEVCITQGNNRGHHPFFALQKLSVSTCIKTDVKLPCPAQLCTAPVHTAATPSSGWMSVSVLQLPSFEMPNI